MIRPLLILVTLANAAQAEFALRDGDELIGQEALDVRLRGNILTFFDDGQSEYYVDGRYTYTYANDGGTAYGYWRIDDGGAVCIEFVNGFARCDLYVTNGARLFLLDEGGSRFPVRP
ncbi:hypothetical protein KUH32_08165 [Thalassococcus sp. CAU 1522]|uniref:Nicotinic acid mononucleotide adenyltransferase n=1 Tax=Thalassococcus arenae TaxID=2851652 RepID=A0ABS6N6V6_9RHOB|nr:hypothetical protein [Thalassococcus arenae]MBV2359746.1 hypothetical protein [Thalassococcus arenae]